jgi:hypothetical protein
MGSSVSRGVWLLLLLLLTSPGSDSCCIANDGVFQIALQITTPTTLALVCHPRFSPYVGFFFLKRFEEYLRTSGEFAAAGAAAGDQVGLSLLPCFLPPLLPYILKRR